MPSLARKVILPIFEKTSLANEGYLEVRQIDIELEGNTKNDGMNPKHRRSLNACERGSSMPEEGTVRKCPHQELDTGQCCRGTQTFSPTHTPPAG